MDKNVLDMSNKPLSTMIKITNVNGEPIMIDPKKWLSISQRNLDANIQNTSAQCYTVERAKDVAELDYQNAQHHVVVMYSDKYNHLITDPAMRKKNNGRKPTESMIKCQIEIDPEYKKAVDDMNRYNYVFQQLKDFSYSMQMKSNLIQTYSSNMRAKANIRDNNDF